jgi:hypothetical protein
MEFVGSLFGSADGDDVGAFVQCGKVHHLLIIYCFMSYIQVLLLLAMQSPSLTFLSCHTAPSSFDSLSFSILEIKPAGQLLN